MLGGCGGPESLPPEGDAVACSISGGDFSDNCILERVSAGQFTIHAKDGSFRRFSYAPEQGVITISDGAEGITIAAAPEDGIAEFSIGPDSYRIPLKALENPAP